MDAAIVVSWKLPFPGREKEALDYAREVNEYWGNLAAEGKCSQPEMFFFETDGRGLWIVKGDREVLEGLVVAEAAERLMVKGELLLQDFSSEIAKAGKASEEHMLRYAGVGEELALV
ncbi:MAG: hypothetical protein M0005_12740 [Actinomycetota bacterium]|jgi:hypothetical protein|nr:hypothetical protein [Actinomycetota bacterium]